MPAVDIAHPAADALLQVVSENNLNPEEMARVTAHVHQSAIDVLGAVEIPQTVHQAKFSMGRVPGHFKDSRVSAFREKVSMVLDPKVDQTYPARWIGKVTVEKRDELEETPAKMEPVFARIHEPARTPNIGCFLA